MTTARYCLDCQYPLHSLSEPRCPECGRDFDPGKPRSYRRTRRTLHPVHVGIGVVLLTLLVGWAMLASGQAFIFFDRLSASFVAGLLIAGLWLTFGPMPVLEAVGKSLVLHRETSAHRLARHVAVLGRAAQLARGAGLLGTLFSFIAMTANMIDPSQIGRGVSIALLPMLYGVALGLLVFDPLRQVLLSRADVGPLAVAGILPTDRQVPMEE